MPASLQPNDPALVEYLEEKFNSMQRALTNQIGDLRTEINDLRTDLKESHSTIRQLRATVVAQRVTYDDLEQYTRRTSVRVNGVPILQGEDDRAFDRSKLLAAVNEQVTAVHPNLVIQPDDVNRFHRSGKPRTDEETGVRSAPVLIQFKHWEPRSRLHGFEQRTIQFRTPSENISRPYQTSAGSLQNLQRPVEGVRPSKQRLFCVH